MRVYVGSGLQYLFHLSSKQACTSLHHTGMYGSQRIEYYDCPILQTNLNEHEVHKHEIETPADKRTAGNEQKQYGNSHCGETRANRIHIIADKHLKAEGKTVVT